MLSQTHLRNPTLSCANAGTAVYCRHSLNFNSAQSDLSKDRMWARFHKEMEKTPRLPRGPRGASIRAGKRLAKQRAQDAQLDQALGLDTGSWLVVSMKPSKAARHKAAKQGEHFIGAIGDPVVAPDGSLAIPVKWEGENAQPQPFLAHVTLEVCKKDEAYWDFLSEWLRERSTDPARELLLAIEGVEFVQEMEVGDRVGLAVGHCLPEHGSVLFEVVRVPSSHLFFEEELPWLWLTPIDVEGQTVGEPGAVRVPTHAVEMTVPREEGVQQWTIEAGRFLAGRVASGGPRLQEMVATAQDTYVATLQRKMPVRVRHDQDFTYTASFPGFAYQEALGRVAKGYKHALEHHGRWVELHFRTVVGERAFFEVLNVSHMPSRARLGTGAQLSSVTMIAYNYTTHKMRVRGKLRPGVM